MTIGYALTKLRNTAWIGTVEDLKEVEQSIEVLADVVKKDRWIPVSERLPEYNESVLTWDGVCFSVEKRIPYIYDDEGEQIDSDWWVSDDYDELSDYYPNLRDGAAKAWMPLPEPYKGE